MRRIVLAAAALAVGLAGCNGNGGDDCPAGTDGCPCRDAGICEVGLTCIDAVCVANSGQGDGDDGGDTYDPDPNFRIRGSLADAGGNPVPENTAVHIYKTSALYRVTKLLNFETIDEARLSSEPGCDTDPNCTYELTTVQTDAAGAFFLSMDPADVSVGLDPDFFCVVHFDGGAEDAQLASATTWYTFNAEQREWDIGELGLWDAPTGVQTGGSSGIVTFDWAASPAPSGRVRSTSIPAYLFATDTQTYEMRWRAYVFAESIVVPRGVFPNSLSVAPTFSVIGASMPSGGGDLFLHRTTVKSVVGDPTWSSEGGNNILINTAASIHQGTIGNLVWRQSEPSAAVDNDLGTPFEFDPDVADIYVDLGGGDTNTLLIFYRAVIGRLHSAVIRVEASPRPIANVGDWTDLGVAYTGFWQGDNWLYLATPPSAEAYQSFHITLEPQNSGGQQPYFLSVAEIKATH